MMQVYLKIQKNPWHDKLQSLIWFHFLYETKDSLKYARKIWKDQERSRNRIARGTVAIFGHASRSDCDVTRCLETRAIKSISWAVISWSLTLREVTELSYHRKLIEFYYKETKKHLN